MNGTAQVRSDQRVSLRHYMCVLCAALKWQLFPLYVIIALETDPH